MGVAACATDVSFCTTRRRLEPRKQPDKRSQPIRDRQPHPVQRERRRRRPPGCAHAHPGGRPQRSEPESYFLSLPPLSLSPPGPMDS
ncbi:hypothetical protein SLUN_15120 [Streptomyces lunaelactis]|uniref:Uncharacterized protein n=1 Tax=Streptomyces lunaelactis TaxID=1535768 RepID=A0A2R4TEA3_9ACTN|nr:hypothetical protein SLUN_15120 [Streptomyces lunaelactis]